MTAGCSHAAASASQMVTCTATWPCWSGSGTAGILAALLPAVAVTAVRIDPLAESEEPGFVAVAAFD